MGSTFRHAISTLGSLALGALSGKLRSVFSLDDSAGGGFLFLALVTNITTETNKWLGGADGGGVFWIVAMPVAPCVRRARCGARVQRLRGAWPRGDGGARGRHDVTAAATPMASPSRGRFRTRVPGSSFATALPPSSSHLG